MKDKNTRIKFRKSRTSRKVRHAAKGTPRLSVNRTLKYVYAQIIDDVRGTTLVAASSRGKDGEAAKNMGAAEKVGQLIAQKALKKGITKVVFDRGARKYHGRVKALADAARGAGLKF